MRPGPWLFTGLLGSLTTVAAGLGAQVVSAQPQDAFPAPPSALAGPSGPAAAAPTEGPADPVTAPPALDDQALQNSLYIHFDVGGQHFNDSSWRPGSLISSGATGDNASDTSALFELGLGFQAANGLGVEIGAGVAPIDTLYAMPVFRVASAGLGPRPLLHTFGARVGWSVFDALGYTNDYYYSSTGGYTTLNSSPGFPSYALCYRVEQMVSGRFSLGLELAYHIARVTVDSSQEAYNSGLGYYTTVQTPMTFDYSGPSACLTVGLWPARPFWGEADRAAQKAADARRLERAEARADRYRRRYDSDGTATPNYSGLDQALSVGQAALDSDQAQAARQAFQQAVLLDPRSPKAWRGLADAEYALQLRRQALKHYQRSLSLGGPDPALQTFILQLKARLAASPGQD